MNQPRRTTQLLNILRIVLTILFSSGIVYFVVHASQVVGMFANLEIFFSLLFAFIITIAGFILILPIHLAYIQYKRYIQAPEGRTLKKGQSLIRITIGLWIASPIILFVGYFLFFGL